MQQRLVDLEGYVALHSNRYSVPLDWIGRRVRVRASHYLQYLRQKPNRLGPTR